MSAVDLFASFVFIFLAAAPGRTTIILVMLSAQGSFKNIFNGAAAAFFVQSFISVILGGILALLPQQFVQIATGTLFVYFGYSFWRQSRRPVDFKINDSEISAKSVFSIVFLAEFGDVSQLAIAATSAKSSSKFSIFLLAVSALWILTGIALFLGQNLKKLIKPQFIQKAASPLFLLIGVFQISQGLYF